MNGAFLVGGQITSHFHRKTILAGAGMVMERFVGGTECGFVVEYSYQQLRTVCEFKPYLYETFPQNKPKYYNLKYSRRFARYSACQMLNAESCHVTCFNKNVHQQFRIYFIQYILFMYSVYLHQRPSESEKY